MRWLLEAILIAFIEFMPNICATDCSNIKRSKSLFLGVLLSSSHRRKIEPVINLALKHVHSMSNLLPDYCLQLIYKDTQVK